MADIKYYDVILKPVISEKSMNIPDEASFEPNLLLGNGVALIDSMIDLDEAAIRKYDLPGLSNDILLVWKDGNPNQCLERFLAEF